MDRSDPSSVETIQQDLPASASSTSRVSQTSTGDEGRFLPGTLIAGRYRIISLLGRGGMGEVYRATDLTLGASVALKFLPEEAARNQRTIERFHSEVRVARQVSHPAICRVYDIGEAEGLPYISMEFVDGEDLASLLTRIGRLPADKALETARKLCAGLAAAHDRGVIHRDLKPANIMINKRGEAVIMDFGLAAIADQLVGTEARNGTPAYMSPEQLKGAEVTAKSDLYALGLVLYELFTGKRPYDATTIQQLIDVQESAQLTSMTSIATDIDPAVEKAIRRCLDPDPAKRPASPLSVAAALPGGDPLAAALAAGETPSPELVAAAGKQEGLARRYSVPCLIVVFVCLLATTALRQRSYLLARVPPELTPEVLSHTAREVAASLGYPNKPRDSALWLAYRDELINYAKTLPQPRQFDAWFAAEAIYIAHYRESPSLLRAQPSGVVNADQPPPLEPGMVSLGLDGHGALRYLSAQPYLGPGPSTPVAPEAVFRAARLDFTTFSEIPAPGQPRSPADQLRAWKGPHPKLPNTELQVQIGSWRGRITDVKVEFPFQRTGPTPAARGSSGAASVINNVIFFIALAMFLFAILFARRNWKLGRVDRRGAFRLASASAVLVLLNWLGRVHLVPDGFLLGAFAEAISDALLSGGLMWLLYLSLEPALRARWPHSIVTWNRLMAGRWLDAQVGAHILIGAAVAAVSWVGAEGTGLFRPVDHTIDAGGPLRYALGTREWIGAHAAGLAVALNGGIVVFYIVFVLRTLLRKDVLAGIVGAVLLTLSNSGIMSSPDIAIVGAIHLAINLILIISLLRLGLVTSITTIFFINTTNAILVGTNWSTWYAAAGVSTLLLLLGIATFAFWRSLGGRELLGHAEGT